MRITLVMMIKDTEESVGNLKSLAVTEYFGITKRHLELTYNICTKTNLGKEQLL